MVDPGRPPDVGTSGPTDPPPQSDVGAAATGRPAVVIEITWASAFRAIVAVLVAVVAVGLVQRLGSLLGMLAFSYFLSLAMEPAVRAIRRRTGWPRGAGVGIVYAGTAVALGLLIAVVLPSLVDLGQSVAANGVEWFSELNAWTQDNFGFPVAVEDASAATDRLGEATAGFAQRALGALAGGVSLLFSLATIALFTFYFSADAPRFQRTVLAGFSPEAQRRILFAWDQAIVQTGAYFYQRVLLMGLNGAGFLITLILVGVPVGLSIALAILAGFFAAFIPAVGTYIGAALPIVVALALQGLAAALVLLAYALVYQSVENYVLVPKLSEETMSLHGGVAFGAAMAGGALGGPIGAFVALPVAALIQSLIVQYGRSYEVVATSAFDDVPDRTDTP